MIPEAAPVNARTRDATVLVRGVAAEALDGVCGNCSRSLSLSIPPLCVAVLLVSFFGFILLLLPMVGYTSVPRVLRKRMQTQNRMRNAGWRDSVARFAGLASHATEKPPMEESRIAQMIERIHDLPTARVEEYAADATAALASAYQDCQCPDVRPQIARALDRLEGLIERTADRNMDPADIPAPPVDDADDAAECARFTARPATDDAPTEERDTQTQDELPGWIEALAKLDDGQRLRALQVACASLRIIETSTEKTADQMRRAAANAQNIIVESLIRAMAMAGDPTAKLLDGLLNACTPTQD